MIFIFLFNSIEQIYVYITFKIVLFDIYYIYIYIWYIMYILLSNNCIVPSPIKDGWVPITN